MDNSFNINVCIASETDTFLQEELQMVKCALLYADKVTITSGRLMGALNLYNTLGKDFLSPYRQCRDYLDDAKLKLNELPDENKVISVLNKDITISINEVVNEIFNHIETYASLDGNDLVDTLETLNRLINKGLLVYNGKCYDLSDISKVNDIARDTINTLITCITDFSGFNLYNKDIYDIIREFCKHEACSEFDLERLKHAKLIQNLIEGLPNFKNASVDEILDIKKELARPLFYFRRAIFGFTDKIKSEPWDKDFEYECKKLYHKDITPAITEIEQKVKDNNIFKNIAHNIANKENMYVAAAGLCGGVISNQMTLGTVTALLPGVVSSVLNGAIASSKENKELRNNNLYFYYKAACRLK